MFSRTSCFVAVAAFAVLAAAVPVRNEPSFCHGLNCPQFTVTNSTSAYEVRQYAASQWARTVIPSINYTYATEVGFQRLFGYISGENVPKSTIPMTTPVTVKVLPGAGPFCTSNFTVSFMVPFKFQPTPPAPTDATIDIETQAAHVAYVASFSGFATDTSIITAASNLAEALAADNITFNVNQFYTAVYDGPYKLIDRHNEVWFYAN